MATQQQLFSLLNALEKLPAAHVPLDAARAKLLGVPTAPDAAFAGAVEALFLFVEQPRPDMQVIEALLGVIEHVTASPGTLQRILSPRAPAPVQKSAPEALLETSEGEWVTGDVDKKLSAAKKEDLAEKRKEVLVSLAEHGPSPQGNLSPEALWSLVSDGLVEHTPKAPTLFRLVQRRKGEATACAVPPAPKRKK